MQLTATLASATQKPHSTAAPSPLTHTPFHATFHATFSPFERLQKSAKGAQLQCQRKEKALTSWQKWIHLHWEKNDLLGLIARIALRILPSTRIAIGELKLLQIQRKEIEMKLDRAIRASESANFTLMTNPLSLPIISKNLNPPLCPLAIPPPLQLPLQPPLQLLASNPLQSIPPSQNLTRRDQMDSYALVQLQLDQIEKNLFNSLQQPKKPIDSRKRLFSEAF